MHPDPDGDQRRRRGTKKATRSRRWGCWALVGFLIFTIFPVAALRWIDPPGSAFMLAARIDARLQGRSTYRVHYVWRPATAIATPAALAVLASEDQRFPMHWGFDFNQIEIALGAERESRVRGASTVSQQVAKNLFLWSGRSWLRKGLEVWFTLWIEALWNKRRILEVYLNIAQFGDGIYGVGAASPYFFKHEAYALTTREAALLAAVLPNPVNLSVVTPSPYVMRRSHAIQAQMQRLGGSEVLRTISWVR